MILSDKEIVKLRQMLQEIDLGVDKKRYRAYIRNRTRNIRLMLTRAERREKHRLL